MTWLPSWLKVFCKVVIASLSAAIFGGRTKEFCNVTLFAFPHFAGSFVSHPQISVSRLRNFELSFLKDIVGAYCNTPLRQPFQCAVIPACFKRESKTWMTRSSRVMTENGDRITLHPDLTRRQFQNKGEHQCIRSIF